MAKQVQLSDVAYKYLKARKKEGESFSDVVVRLAKPKGDPMQLVGAGLVEPGYAEKLQKMREADRRRWQQLERRRSRGRA